MWPCQDAVPVWKKTLNYIMIPVVLLNLVAFYIMELIDFLINCGNITIMTEIMCQLSAGTLLIFEIIYTLYKRAQFQKVVHILENDLFIREQDINKNEVSVVKNCNEQMKILTLGFLSVGSCTAFFWISIPFIDQDNERHGLPFQTWTPVNITTQIRYAVAYTFHIIHALIYVLYFPAISIFYVGTILHACRQLKLLHSSLICLRDIVSQRIPLNNTTGEHMDMNREMFLFLKECIVHHQTILR